MRSPEAMTASAMFEGGWRRGAASAGLAAILALAGTPARADTYAYDAYGRLARVVYADHSFVAYSYDPNGNILGIVADRDADADGIGDMVDPDDDNDGTPDVDDAFPFDPNEQSDFDRDGVGDNADPDDDGDGVDDLAEAAVGRNPRLSEPGVEIIIDTLLLYE